MNRERGRTPFFPRDLWRRKGSVPFFAALAGTLLLAPASFRAAAPGGLSERLHDAICCGHERWREALGLYARLAAGGQESPEDLYRAGLAQSRLNQWGKAVPLLKEAQRRGFKGWPGWDTPERLLARAEAVRGLAPPRRRGADSPSIAVYAFAPDRWSAPILGGVPDMERIGREAFGADLPRVRLYLFPERARYDRFFGALFDATATTAWQDATGAVHVVLASGQSRDGTVTRPHGDPETVSCVMHEFGHAWLSTYVSQRYDQDWIGDRLRTPLLDEGLSDWLTARREPAFLERRRLWVAEKARAGAKPPAFEELLGTRSFYEEGDVELHYWLAALLVDRLLDGRPGAVRELADAQVLLADAPAALKKATGKDAREEYERLLQAHWGPKAGKP